VTSLADLYGDDTPDPERDKWLEWRRQGIGGSDVAAILGLSPWAGPWSVWADKLGLIPSEPENERMRWGHLLEPVIAAEVARRTGLEVAGEQMWVTHKEAPHRRSTIDGLLLEPGYESLDDAEAVLEIKTTTMQRWDNDEVPLHYWVQVQHQLEVTGFQRAVVACLHAGSTLRLYDVEASPEDQARIRDKVDEFWQCYVVPKVQPAALSADLDQLKRTRTEPEKELEAEGAVRSLIYQHQEAKDALDRAEHYYETLSASLLAAIGDAEVITVHGEKFLTARARRELALARVREARPDVWAEAVTLTEPKPSAATIRKLLGKDAQAFELPGSRVLRYA
jgi:putative phage-type endonuclease